LGSALTAWNELVLAVLALALNKRCGLIAPALIQLDLITARQLALVLALGARLLAIGWRLRGCLWSVCRWGLCRWCLRRWGRARRQAASSRNLSNISAINEDLSETISYVTVGWAGISGSDVRVHPASISWCAIALGVVSTEPDPTEDSRFAGIVVEGRELELVVNSVIGTTGCRSHSRRAVELHIVFRMGCRISFIHKRKGRVQSDRFSLPLRNLLAVSVRVVDVVLDADFEIFDTALLEGSDIAVGIFRSWAWWQSLQLGLVLRNEVDEVSSLVLRCDMNRDTDILTGLPVATLVVSP